MKTLKLSIAAALLSSSLVASADTELAKLVIIDDPFRNSASIADRRDSAESGLASEQSLDRFSRYLDYHFNETLLLRIWGGNWR